MGTKFLMEGPVYPEKFKEHNISYGIPTAEQRSHINSIIFDELVYGVIKTVTRFPSAFL
jgi:aspartate racemase